MKATYRVLAVLAVMIGATSLASASTIVQPVYTPSLNPTETFGNPVGAGGTTAAVVVPLSSLAAYLVPGYTISFNAVGEVCFNPSVQGCTSSSSVGESNVSTMTNPIIGGFVGAGGITGGFIASSLTLSSAQQAAVLGDWTALVPNTFIVTAAGTGPVTIPTGATGVVFVFLDSYYGDNSDFSGTLNVDATFSTPGVPEPATYSMMIAGLGALVAFKRLRRS